MDDHGLQKHISSWSHLFGCIWDAWIRYICICCLLWDDWMDSMPSDQIKLVCMDMIMRWYLQCDMTGYISCESTQISWLEVWFSLMKHSSIAQIWVRCNLSHVRWLNLIGLAWKFVCMLYTYSISCCRNFMNLSTIVQQFSACA